MRHHLSTCVRTAAVLFAVTPMVCAQWRQAAPALSPTARTGAAMDFHASLGQVLLFGGGAPFINDETWTYDGSNWTQLTPATSPTARFGAQMVYDQLRNVSVLYGGLASNISVPPPNSDTWEFDGSTWAQITTSGNPGPRYRYGACFDTLRQCMVMFGGSTSQLGQLSNQTWEYLAPSWFQITTTGNPGGLDRPAMCFHPGLGQAVLFGGNAAGGLSDQTWLYNGFTATWTQIPIAGAKPAARNAATMVYDPVRNLCVLTGGQDASQVFADTWTFDGAKWTQQQVTTQGVRDHAMAFLPTIGQSVKFGGFVSAPNTLSNQTWHFGSGALGVGCPGTNGVPTLSASTAPIIGQSYTLNLSNLNPAINIAALVFGFTQLPGIDLAIIDMPGCLAYTSPDILETVIGAGGSAGFVWPLVFGVPGDAFYMQALSLDPTVNGFGFASSNALFATIGN